MRKNQHQMLRALVVASICLLPSLPAHAGVGWKHLDKEVAVRQIAIPLPSLAGPGATVVTQGVQGNLSVQTLGAGQLGRQVQTSSIGTLHWPQRVFIQAIDTGANDTDTCASIVLGGYDQFGESKSETILTIDETGEYSLTVWERLTRVQANNCMAADGSPTSTDYIRVVATDRYLGFGFHIVNETDFISMCLIDDSDTPDEMNCASLNNGSTNDVQSAMSLAASCGPTGRELCNYVDIMTSNLFASSLTPAVNDTLIVRWRPRRTP